MNSKSEMKRVGSMDLGALVEYCWELKLALAETTDSVDRIFPKVKAIADIELIQALEEWKWKLIRKKNKELLERKNKLAS